MSSEIERISNEIKNHKGLKVYAIQKIKLVPEKRPGVFSAGDCFILTLGTASSQGVDIELFAWIGKECDHDEYYAAYNYMKLLSAALPNVVGFNIEKQFHESDHFRQVVEARIGFTYEMGGGLHYNQKNQNESAFAQNLSTVVYQIKGKTHPVLTIVEPNITSLNQGDVFIIKTPKKIFLFTGTSANNNEQSNGRTLFFKLYDQYSDLEGIILPRGKGNQELFDILGGSEIPNAEDGGDDEEAEITLERKISVLNIDHFDVVSKGHEFHREVLNPQCLYIIQSGSVVIVWVGSQLPDYCKQLGMAYDVGTRYLMQNKIPDNVTVSVVVDGHENEQFKMIFEN